jgi:hypothetical protein
MDVEVNREIAVATFNRCWELLDQAVRSNDENVEMLTCAFTSRYHWGYASGPQELIVGDWMISQAAAALGDGHLAVWFAVRADGAASTGDVPDWLTASTAEGVARAYKAIDDPVRRDVWIEKAARLVVAIADDEDRALIASQLATVPR